MSKFPAIFLLLTITTCFTALMLASFNEVNKWIGSRQFQFLNESMMPLLTIFTTIKEIGIVPHHKMAFNIVMANWPSFAPHVRPIVFLNFTNSSVAAEAKLAGWDVLPLEGVNEAGTPLLKDMYRTVFDRYESAFYGFANADILFDNSILKTLWAINGKLNQLSNNVLVMGIRTNVEVNVSATIDRDKFKKNRLSYLAAAKGKLFIDSAIDYFFFTKEGSSMNWSKLSDVAIGRPAYDNYLVAMAARFGVNVIDATKTMLAVHLSEAGVFSHGMLNKDANYNKEILGEFDYGEGFASQAEFATVFDTTKEVVVVRRNKTALASKKPRKKQKITKPVIYSVKL